MLSEGNQTKSQDAIIAPVEKRKFHRLRLASQEETNILHAQKLKDDDRDDYQRWQDAEEEKIFQVASETEQQQKQEI